MVGWFVVKDRGLYVMWGGRELPLFYPLCAVKSGDEGCEVQKKKRLLERGFSDN